MSSNDFGTVNVRRGDRTREIDLVRQRYNRHRETLAALAQDAPSEHLAAQYASLIRDIDNAIGKLGELEGRKPGDTQPIKTEPGSRPLVTPPGMIMPDNGETATGAGAAMPRVALIIGAGVIVLILIGWLMWRASGPVAPAHRTETAPVVETPRPVTPAPKPVLAAMTIDPPAQDYGIIRKGTRAVRQFQVTNNSDAPISLQVSRSTCRCLYYDYANSVAPHAKETVTVTIDGAKAKRGTLHEALTVSTKKEPTASANIDVNAVIK